MFDCFDRSPNAGTPQALHPFGLQFAIRQETGSLSAMCPTNGRTIFRSLNCASALGAMHA